MKTTITVLITMVFVFATCKNNKVSERKLVIQPDPTALFVPDSLRYLLPVLDSVWYRDQLYRFELNNGSPKEQLRNRRKFQENAEKVRAFDLHNLAIVEGIIKKHGWLGPRDVGFRGVSALFLPIQHADLATQEKYLPIIKQAAIDKKITPSSYAMLADRIEIKNKRPQIYGTQVTHKKDTAEILPLLNPDSIDHWRKNIHMVESFKDYVKRWHIEWNVEEYKRKLPELRKRYGIVE